MRDGDRPTTARPGATTATTSGHSGAASASSDRGGVKRKIIRALSRLGPTLLASGAIEPPARPALQAEPPPRAARRPPRG
jgi:hypothetical protein